MQWRRNGLNGAKALVSILLPLLLLLCLNGRRTWNPFWLLHCPTSVLHHRPVVRRVRRTWRLVNRTETCHFMKSLIQQNLLVCRLSPLRPSGPPSLLLTPPHSSSLLLTCPHSSSLPLLISSSHKQHLLVLVQLLYPLYKWFPVFQVSTRPPCHGRWLVLSWSSPRSPRTRPRSTGSATPCSVSDRRSQTSRRDGWTHASIRSRYVTLTGTGTGTGRVPLFVWGEKMNYTGWCEAVTDTTWALCVCVCVCVCVQMSPHSLACISSSNWDRPYSRELAAFPLVSDLVALLQLSSVTIGALDKNSMVSIAL